MTFSLAFKNYGHQGALYEVTVTLGNSLDFSQPKNSMYMVILTGFL